MEHFQSLKCYWNQQSTSFTCTDSDESGAITDLPVGSLQLANLIGPLECDGQKVRPVTFRVFPMGSLPHGHVESKGSKAAFHL